jgi:glycerol-1-phosphate dehydrogenase [NAD(P)+]
MNTVPVPAGLETECFVMEPQGIRHAPEIFHRFWPGRSVWPVADENTWCVAGEELTNALRDSGIVQLPPFIFPGSPVLHAQIDHSYTLAAVMPENCIPVAVGSGTINDLVKYAAALKNARYLVIPTAPSVDGYTAFGAALTMDGFKKTMPCSAPLAIIADPVVLETAPLEMKAAGYADLMAKIPAGADWIVADFLGLAPIRNDVWAMIQHPLRSWLETPSVTTRVFMGLAATGYAMQMCRDSRPASGAEHLLSHIWEMEGFEASHGFKVAVASVGITMLYEKLLEFDANALRRMSRPPQTRNERETEIHRLLSRNCYGSSVLQVALDKFLEDKALLERREILYAGWDTLRTRIAGQLYSSMELKEMFDSVNAPVTPADIGMSRDQYSGAFARAQLIRNRYTVLDLVFELGLPFDFFTG